MFEQLGDTGTRLRVGHVGEFETGKRVPTLQVVLSYARAAGIAMEVIVDDELDLPKKAGKTINTSTDVQLNLAKRSRKSPPRG